MSKLFRILFVLIVVGFGGGLIYLATWDRPPPDSPVERVIPDDRFAR